ncbi:Methyltransf-2 domain-containing protein [Mycena chlorophos]|uniref:Methyltransf-2 domain-containing protein n=1 Tax=Mycena chlorophos TaxID=658473 RepID=A0A8H6S5N1_MYCCL|nr:Methyltransf-2 domain-containing protein [Mycena chlorophos]
MSTITTTLTTLRQLAGLITASVDAIEATYTSHGLDFPSLSANTFSPTDPAEKLRQDPAVSAAIRTIVAATSQLSAEVASPVASGMQAAQTHFISACLNAALELNVVELLRESGPDGMQRRARPIRGLSVPRVLRLLVTHHIFRELRTDVFANNRISAAFDKGKSSKELFERPAERFDGLGTAGLAALAEHMTTINFRSAAELTDAIVHTPPDASERILPFNKAYNTDLAHYAWLHQPENVLPFKRFALAMDGVMAMKPGDGILEGGFDWGSLPAGSRIVDVGSGNGQVSLHIARNHPELRIVNQDLASQIAGAEQRAASSSSKASFPSSQPQRIDTPPAHDFFTPQPITDADVFVLRYITHNWQDDKVVRILQHLRDAAKPGTRLVLIDDVVPAAARSSDSEPDLNARPVAPAPLLPNWGIANAQTYYTDLIMYLLVDGVERTVDGFARVLDCAGWKLERVYYPSGADQSHVVAVPV